MAWLQHVARDRLHYGWIMVGVAFLVLLAAAGVRSVPAVLIVPVGEEFHWSRATISFAVAINLLLYGLLGPFAAALMDRIGIRRVSLLAIAIMAVGIGLTPLMRSAWQLVLLWGVVIGTGSGMAALVLGAVIAARWFARQRGLVMGILTSSVAAGQLIFLPLLAKTVEVSGWRWSVLLMALVLLALLPVVAVLMREQPGDLGLQPYGAQPDDTPAQERSRQNPFAVALAAFGDGVVSRDFWLLSLSFFVCGASTNGLIGTHFIPFCIEHNVEQVAAAGMLASMGIFNFAGVTASGWLSDRFDGRYLLCWYYGLRGLSLLFLPYVFQFSFMGLIVFEVFFGLDWIATVPPTVRLAENAFGIQRAGMMFGWIMAMHQIGSAAIAWAAGLMHDYFGTYTSSFMISGLLCFVASAVVLLVGRRPASQEPAVAATASA
jgi:MFS family permease